MVSKRRNRDRRAARPSPWRNPKPMILCVCEGRVTEPEYLRGFTTLHRNPRVQVVIDGGEGVPRTLVEKAKQRKRKLRRMRDDNATTTSLSTRCGVYTTSMIT